ncbi:MAG TPA: hypothetical protein VG722_07230 [Tepidisphaeraceae bacterium]|nr:hypothetical protein [Tepidisphaeraceae bacterium]
MRKSVLPFVCGILILSIAFTPIAASAAATTPAQSNRQLVINRLEQLGATPQQANAEVSMLNQDDLATLAAHPNMIRRAGASDTGRELFWGLIIVGIVVGITALLANA